MRAPKKIIPVYVWGNLSSAGNINVVQPSEQPVLRKLIQDRGIRLRREDDRDSYLLQKIASEYRVLVIEGISGSGKDTFQAYLKEKIKGRNIYDYSEGELLHSWKHSPIEGIFTLRLEFIRLFLCTVKSILNTDNNAVFILNRLHLSTYVTTIARQSGLEPKYKEIISLLRTLPVHVFVLKLEEHEIEQRSLHSERSNVWQTYQESRLTQDGFQDKVNRYITQQNLMLDVAKKQQIPYSIVKLLSATWTEHGSPDAPQSKELVPSRIQSNEVHSKIARPKIKPSTKLSGR